MKNLVKRFFVEKKEGEDTYYVLNSEISPEQGDAQKAAQFLVDVIKNWLGKTTLFCNEHYRSDGQIQPEDEWGFYYKTPSSCGSCVRAQEILEKIFGSCSVFNRLPFVEFHGDRQFSFCFDLLKIFAEQGEEVVKKEIELREQKAAQKEAAEKAKLQRLLDKKRASKLTQKLDGKEISQQLQQFLLQYVDRIFVVANPDVAVVLTDRSEWGSSGGIGYYDQVRIFCHGQTDMREWQWRDRYSASNDQPQLRIHGIGKVTVTKANDKVEVKVVLVNDQYGNRSTTFTFDAPKVEKVKTLTKKDQVAFIKKAAKEKARIMADLERLWECKPKMVAAFPSATGYVPYRRPLIKQEEIRAEIGVAAFVTEEQIDHRVSDPQIRFELHVLVFGSEKAETVAEDHGYDREGGGFLTILDINQNSITINTKAGKQEVRLEK